MLVELIGGWLSGSLALLADAAHMLADVAALGLALVAAWIAQRPATPERSFGFMRLEILAALINGALLFAIAVGIGVEAWHRLRVPQIVNGPLLLAVAAVGFFANLAAVVVLHRGHEHSLNQRGAYLHVLGDLLGSVGALIAGLILITSGWVLARSPHLCADRRAGPDQCVAVGKGKHGCPARSRAAAHRASRMSTTGLRRCRGSSPCTTCISGP